MDPKQQKAPAPTAAPRTTKIKARVREGQRWGSRLGYAEEGSIVEVEQWEFDASPHCLESLDAVKRREEIKVQAVEDDKERLRLLEERRNALIAARDAAIEGRKIARERAALRAAEAQKRAVEAAAAHDSAFRGEA